MGLTLVRGGGVIGPLGVLIGGILDESISRAE